MSATPDSTLADPERLIADLQRQLAEYKTERDEALQRETASAEILEVINRSPGDLAPVFDTMLEKALRLCEAHLGTLWTYDGESFEAVAQRGAPAKYSEFLRGQRHKAGPGMAELLRGENVIHLPDARETEAYHLGIPARRVLVDLAGARTALRVALRKEQILLGAFTIYRQEVRPFSEKQIALVQNFAAQAVVAMENARLLTETREALEQQTATAEVLQVINSSPGDLAPVFDAMLEKALRLCEAEIGTLWMAEGEKDRAVANRGAPQAYLEFLKKGPHPRPTRSGGIVHIADIRQTEFYRDGHPLVRVGADLGGVRTMLAVPLRKDEVELGRFSIYRTDVRPFTDKQIALLQSFAAQAVIAMENARLITEIREALEQQTATAEVLGVINASPGDLTLVFEAILEKAHSLCGATYGGLLIYDGHKVRMVAAHGDSSFIERWRQMTPLRPPENSPLRRLMHGEDVIHLADAPADENYRNTTPAQIQRLGKFGGVRTLLCAPC